LADFGTFWSLLQNISGHTGWLGFVPPADKRSQPSPQQNQKLEANKNIFSDEMGLPSLKAENSVENFAENVTSNPSTI
jgi:hypothetical protein